MIGMLLSLVLTFGIAAEQLQNVAAPADGPSSPAREAGPGTAVDPKTPIITISGICKKNSMDAESSKLCKTIVTKEQFERLTAALAANGQQIPVNARRQLAQTYADLLAYEQAARSSSLENTPEFQDLMELVRLRTLAEMHRRNLQAKYGSPSQEDIDAYYRQNPTNFIEIKLRRILVPRKNPSAQNQS